MISFYRKYSTDYLVKALPNTKPKTIPSKPQAKPKPLSNPTPKSLHSTIINPNSLNDVFRHGFRDNHYCAPSGAQLNQCQKFFQSPTVKLTWTLGKFIDLPNTTLPEVLLLGHTNAGKSSLINNVLLSSDQGKHHHAMTEYAYVSKKAGYTQTMNCFQINNKFSVVDSPGYGRFGQESQGDMVIEYIQRRRQLRRAFVLIDSSTGIQPQDGDIITLLVDEGISFEIIFTKTDVIIDKYCKRNGIKTLQSSSPKSRQDNYNKALQANEDIKHHYKTLIQTSGLDDLVSFPKLLFNNSQSSKYTGKRYGYKEIRVTMLEACGVL